MMETDCGAVVAAASSRFGDQNISDKDLNKPGSLAQETLPKPTNSQSEMDDDAPRDSMQSNSSLSTITVSTIGGMSPAAQPSPYEATHGRRGVAELDVESVVSNNVDTGVDRTIAKTLSFRTESMGSMGSMGSLISSVDLDSDPHESGSSPDSGNSTPARRNANNVSSSSLLISALKQNNKMRKKSVSFSLPSEYDIARRAQRKNSALLYDELEQFDDNIPDYQVTSPKNVDGRGGGFRQPVRTRSVTDSRVAAILNSDSTKSALEKGGGGNSPTTQHVLPPRPGLTSSTSSYAILTKQSTRAECGPGRSSPLKPILPPPPAGFALHQQVDLLPSVIEEDPSQLSTKSTNSARLSGRIANTADDVAETAEVGAMADTSQSLTLMQRVQAAKTPAELCAVFGITAESVFNGEMVRKRFSRDLLPKQRFVWIVPATKSIHWAKSAKDRLDDHKVKFFLLDKNSPHVNTTAMLSSATSAKEEPLSVQGGILGGHRHEPQSPASLSLRTTFGKINLLSPRIAKQSSSEVGYENEDGSPPSSPTTATSVVEHSVDQPSSIAAPSADADAANAAGASLSINTNTETSAADAGQGAADETALFSPPRLSAHQVLPGRASGELVGVIHSAEIHHLTIKIKTESGDYLSFTIGSGGNAVQRAKDWFAVIKALTRDVSPDI